jgi:hypothetical protein
VGEELGPYQKVGGCRGTDKEARHAEGGMFYERHQPFPCAMPVATGTSLAVMPGLSIFEHCRRVKNNQYL